MAIKSNGLKTKIKSLTLILKKKDFKQGETYHMHKWMKALITFLSAFLIVVVIAIAFISPITKYLIEKYDLKYTGRQITLGLVYVNPFTGYVYLRNVKIYENKSDSIFISANSISANITMHKLFAKTYEISELTLNKPHGIIIQIDKDLNFDDLIEKFSSKVDPTKAKNPVHLNILAIKIIDGQIYYRERVTPINYFIKNVNIESTGIHWNSDTIAAGFSFLSGIGSGGMKGNFVINFKNCDYSLSVIAQKFDLEILKQYVRDLSNFGYFSANLDADLKVKGNYKTAENVTFSGLLGVNEFHVGDNKKNDYASFKKLSLAIFELSPINHKYLFDSVSINRPYFKYELYQYSNNLQKMFESQDGVAYSNNQLPSDRFNLILAIGKYISQLSKNFFRSNYKINHLAIYDGDLKFNDYSVGEKFMIDFDPLTIVSDSISKSLKRVHVFLKSGLKPYGNASINLSINPVDSSDFDLQYQFQKIPVTLFNPYLIAYTSFPLDRGSIEINGKWNVRNGIIQSDNHLVILDPRVTSREKNKNTKWIPMRFIMAFIREQGNVIDYQIPITGDLKNPKFHLHDAIMDLLGNIFIKPVTAPYQVRVKTIETEIEKSLTLKWEMLNGSLKPSQEKFIEKMAGFLAENPNAIIVVHPQQFADKEKEYILFFEAKKKYFLAVNHKNISDFTAEDSESVDKLSIRDTLFIIYLNKLTSDPMLFTIQDKCARIIGLNTIDTKYKQLNSERENVFKSYFKLAGVEKRIIISPGEDIIPFNGFSFYRIDYKGEYPEYLLKAYRRMNKLNDSAPRNLFKRERNKNKGNI